MMYVVLDNKQGYVICIFPQESDAKKMLAVLGDEKINEEFARFAYETWSETEVCNWLNDPATMGLGEQSILFKQVFSSYN